MSAPALSVDRAREHLDGGVAPWVFFKDPVRGRGRVLHRRYDLVVPVDEQE